MQDIAPVAGPYGAGRARIAFTPAATEVICVCAFLLLNPFLALFAMALLSARQRVPAFTLVVSASASFALFFFSREYGVEMYAGSSDDIPQYIAMYRSNLGLSFTDIFSRFATFPNGNEPLWHLPWWALLTLHEADDRTFLLLHYLLLFVATCGAVSTLSRRHLAPLLVVYLFLTPIALDSIVHIWRQQLAFAIFLAGVGLSLVRGKRIGIVLVLASGFMHLSCFLFATLYFVARWMQRRNVFEDRKRSTLALGLIFLCSATLASAVVRLLDSLGVARILGYFEGYEVDTLRVYLLITFYALPLLVCIYRISGDAVNQLFAVMCVAVFSLVLAVPSANSIYDRLLMFVLPLWGLYFFRAFLFHGDRHWYRLILVSIFVFGTGRLYAPVRSGMGVANYLAHGQAFDPLMGFVKLFFLT